jgi:predicted Zn-dependent protease
LFLPGYFRFIHWRLARAISRGREAEAEIIVSRASSRRPKDCALRQEWANFLIDRRRFQEADQVILDARESCADDYQLECVHAEVLHRQGREGEAEQLCNDLVRRYPEEGQAYFILAALSDDKDDYASALALIEKAANKKLSAQSRANAAAIAIHAGARDVAASLAQRAIEDDPRDPTLHILLAVLLEGADQDGAARQWRLAKRTSSKRPIEAYRRDAEHFRSLIERYPRGDVQEGADLPPTDNLEGK